MTRSFKKTLKQNDAIKLVTSTKASNYLWFGGSRSGKTFLNIYIILNRALKYPNSRHLIVRKTLRSTKSSIIKDTLPKCIELCFPELKGKFKLNQSEWFMELPNGSSIWFGGIGNAEEAEKILGNEYATIFCNEVSEIYYRAITKLRTRLAQNIKGCRNYMLYDCNPPSRSHWSYREFIENVNPQDTDVKLDEEQFKHMLLNPLDNMDNLHDDYIKTLHGLPEREKNRFLFGLWQEEVEGAILGTEISQAEQEGRIGEFPHNPKYPVYTGWDIGHSDSTAIWFYQVIESQLIFIDYYENSLEGLPHYIKVLESKPYEYATDFYPHDGGNTEWAYGKTRKAIAIKEHKRNVTVLPKMSKQNQISLARTLFSRCKFDKQGVRFGLERIRNYRYDYNEKFGMFKDKEPLHDENSHGGDSFLYSIAGYSSKKDEIRFLSQKEKEDSLLRDQEALNEILKSQGGKMILPALEDL